MTILNKSHELYFISRDFWEFGGGEIYDEMGTLIGKISNPLFSFNKVVEIKDSNEKLLATLQKKIFKFHRTQELRDSKGVLIATIKRKKIPLIKPKFLLIDSMSKKQYVVNGDFLKRAYKILDFSNKEIIAEIYSCPLLNKDIKMPSYSSKNLNCLKLIEKDEDRLKIIGFVLAIESLLSYQFFLSDLAGYGRLTMRMRPFGPGIREKI